MTTEEGQMARFDQPPVRSVMLAVFFEPLLGMQVSHLAGLREAWRTEYPNSAELPPLRPLNRGGEESSILPITEAWPTPYVMLSTHDDTQSIAWQQDRFVISWRFSGDIGAYPGFEKLADDMTARFDEFSAKLKSEFGRVPVPTASNCDYTNVLPDLAPVDLLVGFASNWSLTADGATPLDATYAGMHLHFSGEESAAGCSVRCTLDWDEDGATLNLDSSYSLSEGEEQPLAGLHLAHDKLIEKFLKLTSPSMHKQWGRQE